MNDAQVILYDSPEAAYQAIEPVWYDRFGRFYGREEHFARMQGCTHVQCVECGTVILKEGIIGKCCRDCYRTGRIALFNSFPVEKWDGDSPVTLFDRDRYFFGEEILDYLSDTDPAQDSELRICKTRPQYLHTLETDDWCDDLPPEGDLPDSVQKALDALNEAIKAEGPVSWFEEPIAIDVADLRARVNARKAVSE